MKVRMITTAAGPAGTFLAGQVADVAPELGEAWVAGGFAMPVGGPAVPGETPETATVEPSETADAPAQRRPQRRPRRR